MKLHNAGPKGRRTMHASIRVPGGITREKLDILRLADDVLTFGPHAAVTLRALEAGHR